VTYRQRVGVKIPFIPWYSIVVRTVYILTMYLSVEHKSRDKSHVHVVHKRFISCVIIEDE
jgi:hypothetical protein